MVIIGFFYLVAFGYITYWSAYAECGHKPIMLTNKSGQPGTKKYIPPSNPSYSSIDPSLTASGYVCTEQQAIDAGYKPMFNPDGSFNND